MRKQQGKIKSEKKARQYRKKLSARSKFSGTPERPRLVAVKTNSNLAVQVVDDVAGKTLASAQTYGKSKVAGSSKSKEGAKVLGAVLADKLKTQGVETVVFDRNGKKYHGVLAALADSLREAGLRL